jgi:hypothetical protein
MRWLAAAVLFAVAAATGYVAYLSFAGISSPDNDTPAGTLTAVGSFWSVLCVGAAVAALWVLRHWPRRSR